MFFGCKKGRDLAIYGYTAAKVLIVMDRTWGYLIVILLRQEWIVVNNGANQGIMLINGALCPKQGFIGKLKSKIYDLFGD